MTDAASKKLPQHWAPDVGDILFLFVILIPLTLLPNMLFGDGSTGWHLVTGDYVLDNHAVPTHDLFSYTFPNRPWIAYEWLSDTIMAFLVRLGGLNLLAVAVSSAIGLMFLVIYDRCRKEGCHFFIVLLICLIGALVSAIHWLARPHLFTFFGVLIYSSVLEDFYRRSISNTKLIAILALYMVVWVNCHPAFLLGLVLISIYLLSTLTAAAYYAAEKRTSLLAQAKILAFALLATICASFCNPYGIKLYQYISEYLKGSAVLAATDEFLSPVFHFALQPTCLEILFALLITALAISRKTLSLPRLLCCIAFCHLSLSAVRNFPLTVIVLLPAIAQLLSKTRLDVPPQMQEGQAGEALIGEALIGAASASETLPGDTLASVDAEERSQLWEKFFRGWQRFGQGIDDMEWQCKMHLLPIFLVVAFVVIAFLGGKAFGTDMLDSGFNPKTMPTTTLLFLKNAEQAGTLQANKGVNLDNWGGYINYKIRTPVFIDDRADFYGQGHYFEYATLSQVLPGWKEELKKWDFEWALFPKASRFAQALTTEAGWKIAAQDTASYLLVRPDKAGLLPK